jgi:hypothetical protein
MVRSSDAIWLPSGISIHERKQIEVVDERIFMGTAVALLCAAGLWHDRWFLEHTGKGQRLVGWLGEAKALWTLRGLFTVGALFGCLLAIGIIKPIQW